MPFKRTILLYAVVFGLNIVCKAQLVVNPGTYQKICLGTKVVLGGSPTVSGGTPKYTYAWTPTVSLNYPDSSNPVASPTVTTTYTVSVRDAAGNTNPKLDTVTLYVYPYYVSVSPADTTIKEGQTITLHGYAPGNSSFSWGSAGSMYNSNTLSPDVFPANSYTYTLVASFPHNCTLYSRAIVNVIPSSELVFYNSFSPNGDGANDVFYIGNLAKYPDNTLDIYNRYGQKIYSVVGYQNDWAGSYLGTELPSGTYFYILDTHDKQGKYKGDVTIIR